MKSLQNINSTCTKRINSNKQYANLFISFDLLSHNEETISLSIQISMHATTLFNVFFKNIHKTYISLQATKNKRFHYAFSMLYSIFLISISITCCCFLKKKEREKKKVFNKIILSFPKKFTIIQ